MGAAGLGSATAERAAVAAAVAGAAVAVGAAAAHSPTFAALGLIAAMFALLAVLDVARGLALLAFLAFAALPRYPTVAAVAGATLTGGWLIAVARGDLQRRAGVGRESWLLGVTVAFLLWCWLTALWATDPQEASGTLGRLVPAVLLVVVAASAVRYRRDALLLIGAMVSGALVGALAAPLAPQAGAATEVSAVGSRLAGFVGDPNELAAMLLPAAILAVGLSFALAGRAGTLARCGVLTAGVLCGAGTLATVSRGGLVAAALALVAMVLFAGRWRPMVAAFAAAALVAGVAWFAAFAPGATQDRLSKADGGSGRTDLWQVSLRMVADRPLTGVGLGSFRAASAQYIVRPGAIRSDLVVRTPRVAHNTYLQVAAEQGLVGLALLLALIVACVGAGVRASWAAQRAGDDGLELLARATVVAQVAVLTAAFFLTYTLGVALWLILALGPALLSPARQPT